MRPDEIILHHSRTQGGSQVRREAKEKNDRIRTGNP